LLKAEKTKILICWWRFVSVRIDDLSGASAMLQNSPSPEQLQSIASQFSGSGTVVSVNPFGSGNINDTFLVNVAGGQFQRFVLQRINTQVFRQPHLVMQNMRAFSEHVQSNAGLHPTRRWEVPQVLSARDGSDSYIKDELFWRSISFIEGSQTFDTVQSLEHAREAGFGLGLFHRSVADLSTDKMADTLPGFHITPNYLQEFLLAQETKIIPKSPEVTRCLKFIADRQEWATVLEDAKAAGKLPLRTIHGDPKINNFLIDNTTNHCISLIDLDTVKPGLVHYDIGDCLRSGCNPLGEETADWQAVHFEPELGQAMLQGYLESASAFLVDRDYDYIYDCMRLIAFELGIRFFTDYLNGSVYFKTQYPEHNLSRALVQFRLAESIESQENTINKIIQDVR
jgi:Ser/Thr protein kinase RdoA (MazF antagonist)